MKNLLTLAVVLSLTGSVFAAEALLQIKKVADVNGYVSSFRDIENGIAIKSKSYTRFFSKKRVPIDLKKKYRVSCEYRLAPGAKSSAPFYYAPVCYDKKGKELACTPQRPLRGTETVLVADAAKGAKVIKVKNASKWVVKWGYVAFDAKADRSDIPNNNLIGIAGIKQNGNVWEITLKKPLAKACAAGTAVRNHRSGATYRYVAFATPSKEWKTASRIFTGAKAEDISGCGNSWRLNTAQVGLVYFNLSKDVNMELRNIRIDEVK